MTGTFDPLEKLIGEVVALRLSLRTLAVLFASETDGAKTMARLHETTSKILDEMNLDLTGLNENAVRAHAETMIDQVFDDGGVFQRLDGPRGKPAAR